MPGYGFAKVSKQQRAAWDQLIFTYLRGRAPLRCVFVLVDSRQGLKDSDEHLMTLLDEAAVAYRVVMTKADKEPPQTCIQHIAGIKAALKKHPAAFPEVLSTSADDQSGIAELRALIISLVG